MSGSDGFTKLSTLAELPPNTLLSVDVGDFKVCLAHADDRVYAFRDNCSHRDFPLSAGTIEDGTVECTWHGARFDVATGRATRLPAVKPIRTYPVRVDDDGSIFVDIAEV